MRRSTRYLVLSASVLFLWSCGEADDKAAAPAADGSQAAVARADRPARKSGLWEHTLQTMGVAQTSRLCIDAATDKDAALWGQQAAGDSGCQQNSFTPAGGGYSFVSVCPDGQGGTVTTRGTLTGDFASSYKMEAVTQTTGSSMPQANGEMKMTMTAAWKGPCPEGMKPGDVQVALPGGGTVNLGDMAKMAGATGK